MAPSSAKDRRRLYRDLSWTWPIVSPPGDYATEARQFRDFFRRTATGRVRTVLHLGCGGGHVDSQLKASVQITGLDLSPSMLRLARRLNPEVTYVRGDMRTARLRETFDSAILSDAGAYMLDEEDLSAAFRTAFVHLRPGGAFVTYAEHTPERIPPNWTKPIRGTRGSTDIVFVENLFDPDPRDTTLEATFLFLIRRKGRLTVEVDRHILGLMPARTWTSLLRRAGFEILHAGIDPSGPKDDDMPWFAARRPA